MAESSGGLSRVAKGILGWEPGTYAVEFLSRGLTNSNYLVSREGDRFVVRLGGPVCRELGIDRKAESAAMALVSRAGIGPELMHLDTRSGDMVTRYIKGKGWSSREFASPRVVRAVGKAIRTFHRLSRIQFTADPYRAIEKRLEIIKGSGMSFPGESRHLRKLWEIRRHRAGRPQDQTALCHNDLFLGNFLFDGSVRILDWEFAGTGDVMVDLACVSCYYNKMQRRELLREYFGYAGDGLMEDLDLMTFVVNFWNALWAMVRMTRNDRGYDFARQADYLISEMERA